MILTSTQSFSVVCSWQNKPRQSESNIGFSFPIYKHPSCKLQAKLSIMVDMCNKAGFNFSNHLP